MNNNVGGILSTNSDGALYYPMGGNPGGVPGVHPYYVRSMGTTAYTQEMAVWEDAWVEQRRVRQLPGRKAARSCSTPSWGDDNVIWSDVWQDWFTSCSQ